MKYNTNTRKVTVVESHPARGGWIEIFVGAITDNKLMSHPARGGWIEIAEGSVKVIDRRIVPPRTGWVD